MTPETALGALDAAAAAGEAPLAIAETALALAVLDRVGQGAAAPDTRPCLEALDALVAAVAEAEARSVEPAATLAAGIAGRLGYRGDSETYDDLANADLIRVLERRRGLPVALGILYIHAARARGHGAAGLNVPSHFMIGVEVLGRHWALDPFGGGEPLGPDDLRARLRRVIPDAQASPAALAPVSDRAVLLRLQNNIKLRRLQAGDVPGGLAVLERMRRMAPELPELVREQAGVLAATGAMRAATAAIRGWLDAGHGDPDSRRVLEAQLAGIGSRLN
ncbi:transglutaminase-like domain-containing protein [Thalassobaculum sp.]|uniref:transglutaminase-like domain-containing protein n=1 Tax=Thalassobaculum sp. TaxID=2022740 RepID=UPI0032EB15B5